VPPNIGQPHANDASQSVPSAGTRRHGASQPLLDEDAAVPTAAAVEQRTGTPDVCLPPKNDLVSWTSSLDKGIRFYSGSATYESSFTLLHSASQTRYWLDLGNVVDIGISRVWLNKVDLGVSWAKPFRVEVTSALKPGTNELRVDVVNTWRNRFVGDRDLPAAKRHTKTNITIRKEWKLLESGLLGPVKILREKMMDSH
jgi:hypothetical protein